MQIIKKIFKWMKKKKGELIMKQKGHERNKKQVRVRDRDQKIPKEIIIKQNILNNIKLMLL